ncbi:hypothetical protein SAMN05660337_3213 [Maridesulfovibrio ferrireducens]|uniref:Uncharacterized protein n=1 Tax=Maridesulfovibrio ferrireducens TaxID=246191 RepID=A0A1G9KTS5_9BACT|nr:hypothetical protein SAMN05660337_3213 [Maridesulfovibrio ferrireducens]
MFEVRNQRDTLSLQPKLATNIPMVGADMICSRTSRAKSSCMPSTCSQISQARPGLKVLTIGHVTQPDMNDNTRLEPCLMHGKFNRNIIAGKRGTESEKSFRSDPLPFHSQTVLLQLTVRLIRNSHFNKPFFQSRLEVNLSK